MSVESFIGIGDRLQPSAAAILRRRVFGHTTFVFGAGTLAFILLVALNASCSRRTILMPRISLNA